MENKFLSILNNQGMKKLKGEIATAFIIDPEDETGELREFIEETKEANFYDEHDGALLQHDRQSWTPDYYGDLQIQLMHNFSRERLSHCLQVGNHLYGHHLVDTQVQSQGTRSVRPKTVKNEMISNNSAQQSTECNQDTREETKSTSAKKFGILVAVGIIVVATGAYLLMDHLSKTNKENPSQHLAS